MLFRSSKSAFDFMVVGLGNPGLTYENTRHNAGFMAVDKLCEKYRFTLNKNKFEALFGECIINGKRVLAVKPQTFMNNSGRAVSAVSSFYKIPSEKMIILFDDISLDMGNIRIRRKGSAGGHNGIKDIIELLGTEEIMRIKIGVDKKPNEDYDLANYVLSKIPKDKADILNKALDNTVLSIEEIIKSGIDSAMNKYSK